MDINTTWRKKCIAIGTPTTILCAIAAAFPVLYLCTKYDCWPSAAVLGKTFSLVMVAWAVFVVIEPISYYGVLGMSGTYMGFTVGNIGNMRLPCASMAQKATNSEPGSLQGEIAATMGIAGSCVTSMLFTCIAAILGASIVAAMPQALIDALTKYASTAIFGAIFGPYIVKAPKVSLGALALTVILCKIGAGDVVTMLVPVFGAIAYALAEYSMKKKKEA